MGCGASVGNGNSNMTVVSPSQQSKSNSGADQRAMAAAAARKRKGRQNIRGTKGYTGADGENVPDLTPIPKSEEIRSRLISALSSHWLFESSTSDQLQDLASVMRKAEFTAGQNIIEQGDTNAREFFFVSKGTCCVVVDGQKLEHTVVPDHCFGELALFYECPRTATIQANEDVETWVLDQSVFRYALASRNEEMLAEHVTFLKNMPVFAETDESLLRRLAEALNRMTFDDGETIVKQGDVGEVFYIVVKGQAKVVENGEEKTHRMKTGDWFGERSLITNEVRSASIIAEGFMECVAVSRADFEAR